MEADGQEEGLVVVVGVVTEKVNGVVGDGRVLQLACLCFVHWVNGGFVLL